MSKPRESIKDIKGISIPQCVVLAEKIKLICEEVSDGRDIMDALSLLHCIYFKEFSKDFLCVADVKKYLKGYNRIFIKSWEIQNN